jgi:hypothetical protein
MALVLDEAEKQILGARLVDFGEQRREANDLPASSPRCPEAIPSCTWRPATGHKDRRGRAAIDPKLPCIEGRIRP